MSSTRVVKKPLSSSPVVSVVRREDARIVKDANQKQNGRVGSPAFLPDMDMSTVLFRYSEEQLQFHVKRSGVEPTNHGEGEVRRYASAVVGAARFFELSRTSVAELEAVSERFERLTKSFVRDINRRVERSRELYGTEFMSPSEEEMFEAEGLVRSLLNVEWFVCETDRLLSALPTPEAECEGDGA